MKKNQRRVMEEDSMELEIDLARYVDILKRWLWFIALGVVVAGGLAYLVSWFLPPIYEAESNVASVKSFSQISLSPDYKTLSEAQLAQGLDVGGRQKALIAIARGGDVASAVTAELGESLTPEERQSGGLLGMVTISADGDLIRIKVQNKDPQKAAKIANAWAKVYANRVNQLYTENPTTVDRVQAQTAQAWQSYQTAEGTLNQFIGQNRIDALGAEIGARQNAVGDLYATQRNLERVLQDAKSLQEVVGKDSAQAPADAGSRLAMLIIRANAAALSYTGSPTSGGAAQPIQLQVSTSALTDAAQPSLRSQLDTLIAAVEARKKVVEAQIADPALQAQILSLQKEQEQQVAKKLELTTARDLAWSTYKTLASKVQEVQLTQQSSGTIVRLAGTATAPAQPIAPKKSTNAMIAALVGLLLSVAIAFVVEFTDPRVRSAKELAKELNLTVFEIEAGERAGALVVPKAFYQVWANLFLRPEAIGKTLLFADTGRGENGGQVISNLGILAANSGRSVILVDCAPAGASLNQIWKMANARGWTNVITDERVDVNACLQQTPVKNLRVMTSGTDTANIDEVLLSPRLGSVVAELAQKGDLVLFMDSALNAGAGALVLGKQVEGVVLVVSAQETQRDQVVALKAQLENVGAKLVGAVLVREAGKPFGWWRFPVRRGLGAESREPLSTGALDG